jgi:hypothetical protein
MTCEECKAKGYQKEMDKYISFKKTEDDYNELLKKCEAVKSEIEKNDSEIEIVSQKLRDDIIKKMNVYHDKYSKIAYISIRGKKDKYKNWYFIIDSDKTRISTDDFYIYISASTLEINSKYGGWKNISCDNYPLLDIYNILNEIEPEIIANASIGLQYALDESNKRMKNAGINKK